MDAACAKSRARDEFGRRSGSTVSVSDNAGERIDCTVRWLGGKEEDEVRSGLGDTSCTTLAGWWDTSLLAGVRRRLRRSASGKAMASPLPTMQSMLQTRPARVKTAVHDREELTPSVHTKPKPSTTLITLITPTSPFLAPIQHHKKNTYRPAQSANLDTPIASSVRDRTASGPTMHSRAFHPFHPFH